MDGLSNYWNFFKERGFQFFIFHECDLRGKKWACQRASEPNEPSARKSGFSRRMFGVDPPKGRKIAGIVLPQSNEPYAVAWPLDGPLAIWARKCSTGGKPNVLW